MSKRKNKKAARPVEPQIIDPYKVVDENVFDEEYKNMDYEPPVFSIPELDRILVGTDKEAAMMLRIYLL